MPKTIYIAETNETGEIENVWIKPAGKPTPRVFHPGLHVIDRVSQAEFCGAKRTAILAWIASHGKDDAGRETRR